MSFLNIKNSMFIIIDIWDLEMHTKKKWRYPVISLPRDNDYLLYSIYSSNILILIYNYKFLISVRGNNIWVMKYKT